MTRSLLPGLLAVLLGASACGGSSIANAGSSGRLRVAAAFYPLEYLATRIGGDRVEVVGLTKPGAEPHDAELTARQLSAVNDADVVVYEAGLQGAVDDAIPRARPGAALDVTPSARLDLASTEEPTEGAEQGEHEEAGHDGHDHGPVDPHFWLDPQRFATVAQAIGRSFAEHDPDHRRDYLAGVAAVTADLDRLDRDFERGLARCTVRDLVTSHAAFAYLAERYGLHQVSIAGLSPEAEPDAATMREVIDTIRAQRVPTIYAEPSSSTGLTRTVAEETGVQVAVLDPVESITGDSAGRDYLAIMRANLQTLRAGQECR